MLVINIAGAHSNVGKTTLAITLSKSFPGFKMIKVSPDDTIGDFLVEKVLNNDKNEKDSTLFSKVADEVYLIRGSRDIISRKLRKFIKGFSESDRLIIEGNSAVTVLPWAMNFFVAEAGVSAWKENAIDILKKSDIAFINHKSEKIVLNEAVDTTYKMISENNEEIPVIIENLARELSNNTKGLLQEMFAEYLEKDMNIKDSLITITKNEKIACHDARVLAGKMRVSPARIGWLCEEIGVKITNCEMGCF